MAPRSDVAHGRQGHVVLPPAGSASAAAPPPQDPVRSRGRDDEFLKEAMELRRSRHVAQSEEYAVIQRIGRTFDDVPQRCLDAVRSADTDMVYALMRILAVHGQPENARDLEYLLLTRSFKSATDVVVETMAELAREDARSRLLSCLTASRPAVRHHAALALETRVTAADAQQLLLLSEQESGDVQIKAMRLLGFLPPSATVRARLVAALSGEPMLAEAAVDALVRLGPDDVADVQEILRRPAVGRSSGYASLVLAGIEESRPGLVLFDDVMVPNLVDELDVPDPFQRVAVAIGLAGLAWRSDDVSGERFHDREVVDALVDVVAPREFVAHLATLRELAQPRLAMLTGKDFGPSPAAWREWWTEVSAASRFVGTRHRVALTVENANTALLEWRTTDELVVVRGERTIEPDVADGTFVYLVTAEEFADLVGTLERFGFMGRATQRRGVPDERQLTLVVGGAVVRADGQLAAVSFDRFGAEVAQVAQRNRWQLYRDPEREPDAAAFWRAERRWLDQHPDAGERADRLKARLLAILPRLDARRTELAIADLSAIPDLASRMTEADGLALVEAGANAKDWDKATFRLLELALLARDDAVWQRLVDVARARDEAAGSTGAALQRIFALVGPERVVAALGDESELVRRVAIDEIANLGDLAAAPRILAIALDRDAPSELRRTAVFALGKLRAVDARGPLIAMLDQGVGDAGLRRTAWIAIARIGGEEVFPVLQRAFPTPDEADRRAIVQALGAMRHPLAAQELANIFTLRSNDTLGALALDQLRQCGDVIASPALIAHVDDRSEEVRRQVALLLGEFQHPAALPELMAMLSLDAQRLRVVSLIAGVTGLDLSGSNDRLAQIKEWFDANRSRQQGDWLLAALNGYGIQHGLRREQLTLGAGTSAVPELTRLTMEVDRPWLAALCVRLLRVTTGQDYGTIGPTSNIAQRQAICDRYRFLHDSTQAASGR